MYLQAVASTIIVLAEERRRDEEQLRFLEESVAVTVQGAGSTGAAIKEMDETVKLAMNIACMMRHSKSLTKDRS